MIDDQVEKCPNCGGPNNKLHRSTSTTPKTIEELKAYVQANNVPVERMHFHIGEDYKGAKAFGIYKNGKGETVVYKNKADGSRAIRYQGKDEAYGVKEIFTKMREEYLNAREYNLNRGRTTGNVSRQKKGGGLARMISSMGLFILIAAAIYIFAAKSDGRGNGYYRYNDRPYYYQSGSWYEYDDNTDTWEPSYETPDDLKTNKEDYYASDTYNRQFADSSFEDSYYYEEPTQETGYDNDWGSSDDWSSGDDWDFDGGTDWDSDW